MKIHEYQGKELFEKYDFPIIRGFVVDTGKEAAEKSKDMKFPLVLKAQVHVGGRGKAGGVRLINSHDDIEKNADEILNLTIKGLPVRKLLVVEAAEITKEVYLSLLIDRGTSNFVFVGCAQGGVEIEETAKTNPEAILRLELSYTEVLKNGNQKYKEFAQKLFDSEKHINATCKLMESMGRMFLKKDCSLIEINPLIIDDKDRLIALDSKVLLDDSALYRQEENSKLMDMDSEDLDELEAKKSGLSFIRLEGEVGCMVNGAGLAMATMDIINHFGGKPANFLDVGGSSDPKKVVKAFEMVLKDKNVKSILINIFGGITRCDDIAKGILTALDQLEVNVPIVVRLVGTNEKEGRELLKDTNLIVATTLEDGAKKAVELGGKK